MRSQQLLIDIYSHELLIEITRFLTGTSLIKKLELSRKIKTSTRVRINTQKYTARINVWNDENRSRLQHED